MLTQVEAKVFDKTEFLKSLGNLKLNTLQRLEVCIQTEEDANRYLELVKKEEMKWKGQTAHAFASMVFREEQIDKHSITFEEVETFYQIDPSEALQMLFWQTITKEDVDKLMSKWLKERTLKDLYEKHEKDPYENFFAIVL